MLKQPSSLFRPPLRRTVLVAALVAALTGAADSRADQGLEPDAAAGSSITVTTCEDSTIPPDVSLRDAISAAQIDTSIDLTHLDCDAIVLTQGKLTGTATSVHLIGPGRDALRIDGDGADLVIDFHGNLEISDLTVTNGSNADGLGGCIRVHGDLTLTRSVVSGCTAGDPVVSHAFGGGLAVIGSLLMQYSEISHGGALSSDGSYGGGAYVSGTALILDSTIDHNLASSATAGGGGVSVSGDASIVRSDFIENRSDAASASRGGAIDGSGEVIHIGGEIRGNWATSQNGYAYGGGISARGAGSTVAVSQVRMTANIAESECSMCISAGGGISNDGPVTVVASTIDANRAISNGLAGTARGGGIWTSLAGSDGLVLLVDSTISANSSLAPSGYGIGGGISAFRSLVGAYSSTVAFNSATTIGGGIAGSEDGSVASFLYSTIVANNEATEGADISGGNAATPLVIDGNHNLVMEPAATVALPPDTSNADPLLSVLGDNFGPTPTHALPPCSPAVDTGSNPLSLENDQRGPPFLRGYRFGPDIGAYEQQPNPDAIFESGFELPAPCP